MSKTSDAIENLKPLRNANIQWQRNGTRVLLGLPWPKDVKNYKHTRPIETTGIAQVVMLKPIMDEIWLNCDGEHTILQIYEEIQSRHPETELLTFDYIASKINMLLEKRWLTFQE